VVPAPLDVGIEILCGNRPLNNMQLLFKEDFLVECERTTQWLQEICIYLGLTVITKEPHVIGYEDRLLTYLQILYEILSYGVNL
jgi:hypothetical protein